MVEKSESWEPATSRQKMSRPWSSVPSQLLALGGISVITMLEV